MSGDAGTTPYGLLGDDYGNGGPNQSFEPNGAGAGYGCANVKFFKGLCVDSLDAPIANAIVTAFTKLTDIEVGQNVTAAADGSYIFGCNTPPPGWLATDQHYLVAYKTGSPDIAGTTVNTLTPTNIDGT